MPRNIVETPCDADCDAIEGGESIYCYLILKHYTRSVVTNAILLISTPPLGQEPFFLLSSRQKPSSERTRAGIEKVQIQ